MLGFIIPYPAKKVQRAGEMRNAECGMKCQVINFPNVIIWPAVPAANDLKPAAGENKALPQFASECKC